MTSSEKIQRDGELLHYSLFHLRSLCKVWYRRSRGEAAFDSVGRARLLPPGEEVKLADSHVRIVDGYFARMGVSKPSASLVSK